MPYPPLLLIITVALSLAACEHDSSPADEDTDVDADNDDTIDSDLPAHFDAETDLEVGAEPTRVPWSVFGSAIRAETGEALFLRGVNISQVSKDTEDHLYPLDRSDAELLRQRGFNSVRMLTFWDAVMPLGPEEIDVGYLEAFAAQVELLAASGLYIVIDMHQDLYGEPFGNGAPEWSCPEEIRAGYEPTTPWWVNYSSSQVTGCFDNFYTDEELQEFFLESWSLVAEAVCSTEEVVGFDAFNEPWPGSSFGDRRFDNETLIPLYLRVLESVEAVCPGRLYFLEPTQLYYLGLADRLEFPRELRDRIVIAPHWYPTSVHEPGDGWTGTAEELEVDLRELYQDFIDQGTPVWIGEWGGITENPNFDNYFDHFTEATLRLFVGSALWEYSVEASNFSFLNADRVPREAFASSGRVPIPTLLPSPPLLVDPDVATGSLTVEFECIESRRLEILLPEDGPEACSATPPDALALDEIEDHTQTGSCLLEGALVTIDCL